LNPYLPADDHELDVGGVSADAAPDVHGEYGGGGVEDGRQ